tara:strand:+ start:326 stop:607 length:282 start_codon:yes stop_codon:yes gene_type:complete
MPKNTFGKKRDVESPYAVYHSPIFGGTIYHVLKTRQHSSADKKNPHTIWYVAGKGPATMDSWEYGDMYKSQLLVEFQAKFVDGDPEWRDEYNI